MSRQRRNFSAKFKSDLVIELLKGEKDLNTLAVENNIQPNLLRNWKKEFLDNASVVFDDKREDNLKEKLAEERKEKAEYAKKVGQLTMQYTLFQDNSSKERKAQKAREAEINDLYAQIGKLTTQNEWLKKKSGF